MNAKLTMICTALPVMLAVTLSAADKPGMLQDFEKGGGDSFSEVWHATAAVSEKKAHAGKQSLAVETVEEGGTVGIFFTGGRKEIDLSKAKKITVWVYDVQGENTVEMRLKDANGNGGSGPDGNALWSASAAKAGSWTKIEWNLADYPEVSGLDRSRITSVELYEQNPGVYYFDDLQVE